MEGEELRVVLDAEPSAVREARHFLRTHLERWEADAYEETATLLVSEVVTNVVLHARTPSELVLRFDGDALQVEVHDRSGRLPQGKRYGADATTGRGLRLLETLSARWGAEPTATGKYVWFRLDGHEHDGAASSALADLFDADLAELEGMAGDVGSDGHGEAAPGGDGRRRPSALVGRSAP